MGLPRFDGRSAFSTWTYRIATNAALDELRKRGRRPVLHVDDEAGDSRRDIADPLAHRRVDGVVDRLTIDEALDELPEEFRLAVVLRDLCDYDYAEIAATLDIPVGTVKSRIARGRSLLVGRLGNQPPSAERRTATPPNEATDD